MLAMGDHDRTEDVVQGGRAAARKRLAHHVDQRALLERVEGPRIALRNRKSSICGVKHARKLVRVAHKMLTLCEILTLYSCQYQEFSVKEQDPR